MLWVKALHVISVIAWMAALLYLPRLFVYHATADVGSELSETLKIMERRLLKAIATPAMIASWVFGIWTAVLIDPWTEWWFILKLVLVTGLSAFHMVLARHVRIFAAGENNRSQRYFRLINEVPTLVLVAVVILVIVKPF